MKKVMSLLLAGCLTLGLAGATWAANSQTLATDIIGLADGNLNVEYEKPFGGKSSLLFGAGIVDYEEGDTEISGFGFSGSYRLYINDKLNHKAGAFQGFFIQGTAGVSMLDMEFYGDEDDQTVLAVGGLFGYKYIVDGGFTIEGGIGPVFTSGDDFHDYETGVDVGLSLKAGYTW
ncbi:MAG TPA: DUF3575 domain-containing protein [Bacillota bacterium]|nr:DUF3575 domain-containing protein [Bacillota bacterium]